MPRGKNGFGFDEIFELPNGLTLGELTLEEKLKVSPRKRTLDMVEKYMVQLIPSVQNHLRERLHNRKITMTVRVSAPTENIRAYSHVERFQMMSKKNPNLLKLKEALGLELS